MVAVYPLHVYASAQEATLSEYQKMVREEARTFNQDAGPQFDTDGEEHGGKSEKPNFAKWLDRTRKLFAHLDNLSKSWTRAEVEMVKQSSKNAVPYGNPKESAYFAFHKDLSLELKKIRKN